MLYNQSDTTVQWHGIGALMAGAASRLCAPLACKLAVAFDHQYFSGVKGLDTVVSPGDNQPTIRLCKHIVKHNRSATYHVRQPQLTNTLASTSISNTRAQCWMILMILHADSTLLVDITMQVAGTTHPLCNCTI